MDFWDRVSTVLFVWIVAFFVVFYLVKKYHTEPELIPIKTVSAHVKCYQNGIRYYNSWGKEMELPENWPIFLDGHNNDYPTFVIDGCIYTIGEKK
jgi:hypothetical protein